MADLELWYPAAVRDPVHSTLWGSPTDTGEPKIVLHTTEGPPGVYTPDPRTGLTRTYYGNTGTWPNYTLAYYGPPEHHVWRIYQHIPSNRPSMSLRNLTGGVQTNRDNVTQVEIAWKAVEIAVLPDSALDVLAELLAWEHRPEVRGLPLVSPVRWVAYPASYGSSASQRLSGPTWDDVAGVVGHQHVPENDHGDPGRFPAGRVLQRAREHLAPPEENIVTPEQETRFLAAIGAVPGQVWRTAPADGVKQADMHGVVNEIYRKTGDIQHPKLTGLAAAADRIEAAVAAGPALGDVTEAAVHDALDKAVDLAAVARIVEHGSRVLAGLLTRPAVLPPSEDPPHA